MGKQDTGWRQSRETSSNGLHPVSCVPIVASVSELSSSCVLCAHCWQCLWIVFIICLVYPLLCTQDTGWRQFRDTGSNGHTRHRMKTIQRHWQQRAHNTQDEDNPETLATMDTQDTGWRQFRDTRIVFILCLVCPLLPVFLDCFHPVSCVPIVASVSELSSSCVLCAHCCQCLWIVRCLFCLQSRISIKQNIFHDLLSKTLPQSII
jgi:hypothetical protein